jgi:hypothetical protein
MVITVTAKIKLPPSPELLEDKMAVFERANLSEMLDYAASTGRWKTIVRPLNDDVGNCIGDVTVSLGPK